MKTNIYKKKNWLGVICFTLIALVSQAKQIDKTLSFSLNCPPNAYVSCTDELWNLSIYGNATYTSGYYTYSAGSPTVQYNLNSCNAGTITRTWMVEDQYWNWHSCTQTIFVSSGGSGAPLIDWPEDIELTGCNPNTNPSQFPEANSYPTWESGVCSMLGRSYSDMLFTVNSQCKKIMRTWKVLDWCNYTPTNGYGIYTKVQIIYIINNTAPAFTCPAEITINTFNCKDADVVATPLTIDPSVCGGKFDITNNSPFATSKGNNISGKYPIGTTKVTFTVKYGCGKTKTCVTNVVVKNASRPTPYCNAQIVTTLMPLDTNNDGKIDNGMVELWAKDLNKGSFSACGFHPLKFSFSKNVAETSKTFTCDNVGTNIVQMWVTDSKGGQEYCEVQVIIQNNGANIPDCKPKPVVIPDPIYSQKGNVLTLTDTPLNNAEITLKYIQPIVTYKITYDTTKVLQLDSFINLSGYKLYRYVEVLKVTQKTDSTVQYISKKVKTNVDGKYLLDSLKIRNKAIDISATYADDARKNIDSKDVELLTKFLLGEITFSSFHQYLASDINEDGKVDVKDQNLLMEFVTGATQKLPGLNQWYLLDKKISYLKPEDVLTKPLPFFVRLDSIKVTNPAVDFIAIKKGNISVDPGSLQPVEIETRVKHANDITVNAFPNPFAGELTFKISSGADQNATLRIFNITGQEIIHQSYNLVRGQNDIKLNVENEVPGLLMYAWTIGNQQFTGKLSQIK